MREGEGCWIRRAARAAVAARADPMPLESRKLRRVGGTARALSRAQPRNENIPNGGLTLEWAKPFGPEIEPAGERVSIE